MLTCPPDGPSPSNWMVVGEAPAREEMREGRGFVGPSGKMLWPLMRRLASLERSECYVTNLCKHPLDNSLDGDEKLEDEEFGVCAAQLWEEIVEVQPTRILAVGVLAARGILGERFTTMEACNGIGFEIGDMGGGRCVVVPTWHPAAALRPGGEDKLAFTGAAISALREPYPHPLPPYVPEIGRDLPNTGMIGIDTEGTVEDPICVTVATKHTRCWMTPHEARIWWRGLTGAATLVYHNAPWDWRVLEAMGIEEPWRVPYVDTMERAYVRSEPTKGLKPLAWRYLGLKMRDWEDVVMPHYKLWVQDKAAAQIELGTTTHTHSAKGRLLKKPKYEYTPEVKALRRLRDPEKIAERLGLGGPSLRQVPEAEAREYATLDPWATLALWEAWTKTQ